MRFIFFCCALLMQTIALAKDLPLNLLKLPPRFKIELYAANLPSARQMALGSNDIVFVGSLSGSVYAVVPDNQHGKKVLTIAQGLNAPNGVAFLNGNLYVAEINRILRFDDIEHHLGNPPKPVVITDKLPEEAHHGFRYIRFGKDDKLYLGIGMPCNVCLPKKPLFGTITRMNKDGSNIEIFAKGVRNSVGFDWDPKTQKLWFTDNGRDYMGDDSPPDKLDYAPVLGLDFGFPYYDGKSLPDPIYGKKRKPDGITFPAYELPAHVAVLGMTFYNGTTFPPEYRDQIFIAEHGSWNRSKKIGYQVVVTDRVGDQVKSIRPFVSGWLQGEQVWGRPVDVMMMRDGSLLVSDDFAGVIYRISHEK